MRIAGWENALRTLLDREARTPFVWGSADCLHLAGDAVLAITGADPIADLRGRYRTARGAKLLLRRMGFADMGEAVASRLPEIAPGFAGRGDVAIVPFDGDLVCGLVTGTLINVRAPSGLGAVSLPAATRAFRVE